MDGRTPAAKIGLICNALEAKWPCYFKAFRLWSIGGAVRFDLRPSKRASNGVQMDAKKPGREADTPALLSWLFLLCEAVLSRKRAAALLRHPLEAYTRFASVRFLRVR